MTSPTPFNFPSIYKFPPFFTKQIHLDTANTQLTIWCKLILEYCKHYNIWILNNDGQPVIQRDEFTDEDDHIKDIPTNSIFTNKEINRSLKPDFIKEITNQLCKNGNLELINNKQFYVYHHTLEELGNSLLQWVENTGQQNSVLTLYELSNGELNQNEFFHNINQEVLVKIVNLLALQKKAIIMKEGDQIMGVKVIQS